MMHELDDIMKKYYTDKCSLDHNYVPYYYELLKNIRYDNLNILEIGIYRPPLNSVRQEAASLKTWYEYLPNSYIYGIDLDDFSNINNDRIKTFICDHDSSSMLQTTINSIGKKFDIIIDDGSHMVRSNQFLLGQLFKHLKNNGVYIIEDLHTSYMKEYLNGDSTVNFLKNYIENKKIDSQFINYSNSIYIQNTINKIDIYKAKLSEIAFIYKK